MPLSFAQLNTPLTRTQALEELRKVLSDLGFSSNSWQSGSVQLTILYLGAELYSKLSERVTALLNVGFNETAIDEALDRLSVSHYDNTRNAAVATQGTVKLTLAVGSGPYTIAVSDLLATNGSQVFRNITGGTLSAGTTPLSLTFEAEIAGQAGNVAIDTITQLVTPLSGVTINNPFLPGSLTWVTRTGTDKESNAALRLRNSSQWASLSVEAIADTVENLMRDASAAIAKVKVNDGNPRGAGTADVYIAGEVSVVDGSIVTTAQTKLNGRFFGNGGTPPRVQAIASAATALTLAGTVYYDSKYASTDVQAAVEAALLAFIKTVPLGGFNFSPSGPSAVVPKNDIESVIRETLISGVKVVKTVVLSVPTGDVSVPTYNIVTVGSYASLTYSAVVVT